MPITFNGRPGDVWTNEGQTVQYQLVCALINTCGYCLNFHMAIADHWATPFHRSCACEQFPIAPGQQARPSVDFRDWLERAGHAAQVTAVGRAVYRLIESRVIRWHDAIAPDRVRSLAEIVAINRLTLQRLIRAGVQRGVAERAIAMSTKGPDAILKLHRAELTRSLERAGLSRSQAIEGFGKILAADQFTDLMLPEEKRKRAKPDADPRDMIAGSVVLERLRREAEDEDDDELLPNFGSLEAMRAWLTKRYGDTAVATLTNAEWAALLQFVTVQRRVRGLFKRLGADERKVLRAMQR